jgi:hypothetical protein
VGEAEVEVKNDGIGKMGEGESFIDNSQNFRPGVGTWSPRHIADKK